MRGSFGPHLRLNTCSSVHSSRFDFEFNIRALSAIYVIEYKRLDLALLTV